MFLTGLLRGSRHYNNPLYYNIFTIPLSKNELIEHIYKYNREISKYNPNEKTIIQYDVLLNLVNDESRHLLIMYKNQIKK